MLLVATAIFLYYTAWTLLMVCESNYEARIRYSSLIDCIISPSLTKDILSMTSFLPVFGRFEFPLFSLSWARPLSGHSSES